MVQTTYTADHLSAKTVRRSDESVLTWLKQQHDLEITNLRQEPLLMDPTVSEADKLKELKKLKRNNMRFVLATAFGTLHKPSTPTLASRKIKDNGGVLRQFIALDYDLEKGQEDIAKELWDRVRTLFSHKHPTNYAIYPSSSYPILPRLRVVIETQELLDRETYRSAAEYLINYIGIETNDFVSNTSVAHPFNAPWYWHPDANSATHFVLDKTPLSLEDIGWTRPKSKAEPVVIPYRDEQLESAIQSFIEDPEQQDQLKDYNYFWRFAESLADANLKGTITHEFAKQALMAVAMGNKEWEENNLTIYEEQKQKLQHNPDKRAYVKPLGTYLPIVSQVQQADPDVQNLATLLAKLLPPMFAEEEEISIKDACDTISQFFEFGLLPDMESDMDALAIFNPLTGLWTHDVDDLIAMLSVVKPAISQAQVNTALMYWAAQANRNNQYIKPYSGSQYLVFQNGVLDIISETLHPLNADLVKRLEFTSRHQLKIDYNPEPELITYKQDGIRGGDWNIEQFLMAYADNDPEIRTYLLFGLSLGLFPNHTFGVSLDIQGESGSGKSTLSTIYKGLYGSRRVAEIIFSDMNKDFPLNTYHYDTAIIWAKECNEGANELSEEYGVNFYDSLADPMARIPVKHSGDLIIENPPQLFVDGTVFISAKELDSGVSRRTLAFKLPSPIEPLREQYYSNNITERLLDETTLQYLVVQMIEAYKTIVPNYRWSNFKMNLGIETDMDLLPTKAKQWRYEFVSADANIRKFYEEQIKPNLHVDDSSAWINDDFLHRIYLSYYVQKNPQDTKARYARRLPNFTKIIRKIFQEEKLYQIEFRDSNLRNRKRLSTPTSWGFNWDQFLEEWLMPERLETQNAPEIYDKKIGGMYRLVTEKPSKTYYELTKDGTYVPDRPTSKLPD